MTNSTGFRLTTKDIVFAVTIGAMIVTFFVRIALTEAKVERNTLVLETYNLPVIDYQLGEMNKKLDNMTLLIERHMEEE